MLAKASFLAENVQPSARENILRAMSRGDHWVTRFALADEPGVFREPAGVEVERNPMARATARTASRLRIETGCPPPELFVTVTMIRGMRSLPSAAISFSSASEIEVAFEVQPRLGVGGFR